MPMFDYECMSCGHIRKDKIIKSSDGDLTIECPECGEQAKRLYGLPRFKMGKSCFVKLNPSVAEQKGSELLMEDYKKRAKGEIS